MKEIIIIAGPTAVGKTNISVEIAKKLNTEIISSDSMQIYKKMDIGTNKIKPDEMENIPHHMIDIVSPFTLFTVSDFYNKSKIILDRLFKENKIPVIAGGTGLYINSLIYKMDFNNSYKNDALRKHYENIQKEKGNQYLYSLLKEKYQNSNSFKNQKENPLLKIDKNNVKRVIRALEILDLTGSLQAFENVNEKQDYKINLYVLNKDRTLLYNQINKRVDLMIQLGLVHEVKSILTDFENLEDKTLNINDIISLKAIGYKEIISYLNNEISLNEAIDLIKRNSRRYAKRQLTWFKRYDFAKFIDVEKKSKKEIVDYILEDINK